MVCILTTLATYKFYKDTPMAISSKITASCGIMCVTLIRLPFKHKIVTNIIYLLADMCILNAFGLVKIQSLLLYFNFTV